MAPRLKAIVELGVDEAYGLLAGLPEGRDLPPLDAIENEDWGRDYLLSRLLSLDVGRLRDLGLTADDPPRGD